MGKYKGILHVSPNGRYFVTTGAMGTYDIFEWPALNQVGNRDWKTQAVEQANTWDADDERKAQAGIISG